MSGPSQTPPTLEVVGPEGVPLRFTAASLVERFLAFAIDGALIALATMALALVAGIAIIGTFRPEPMILLLLGAFVLRYGYFVFFEVLWLGATPGKRLLKLKVISRDGNALETEAIIARNVMRDVELFIPLVGIFAPQQLYGDAPWWLLLPTTLWTGIMVALPFLSKERARAGDLIAGTLVVRMPEGELAHDAADREAAAQQADALVFTRAQLAVYGAEELEALAHLLRKHDEGKASDDDLRVIGGTIARKIGFSGAVEPKAFLRAFYQQQRASLEKRLLFGQRKQNKES